MRKEPKSFRDDEYIPANRLGWETQVPDNTMWNSDIHITES